MTTQEIVAKLWNLCNVLRDDGITYHQYVTELTYILFLKMAKETYTEDSIPEDCRWDALRGLRGLDLKNHYKKVLDKLGTETQGRVREIYAGAATNIDEPKNLEKIITSIDELDWFSAKEEGLGSLYEGLLEKNANEKKSGAGQYFTPRVLIDVMTHLVKPQPGERCNDPACGTFGFMIAAAQYVRDTTDDYADLTTEMADFEIEDAFSGCELVHDTHRLALMNAMLHGIDGPIYLGDTLSDFGKRFKDYDVVLTNPPFGTKKGGERATRDDFTYTTSNKQLNFLQHIYRSLKHDGKARAAVVLPDNVLFADGDGQAIRRDLMEKCDLHTILRLPTGIFYAQGVKTNVLFFTRGESDHDNTQEVWFYDLRTNMPSFGKTHPLRKEDFADFVKAYESDDRKSVDDERWQCFTREEIAAKDDSLDLGLIKDDSIIDYEDLPDPVESAESAIASLKDAVQLLQEIADELRAAKEQSVGDAHEARKAALLNDAFRGKLTATLDENGTAQDFLDEIYAAKEQMVKEKKIKKPKRLPPITDEEKPFAIPDNWRWVRFGDILRIINGDRGKNYPPKKELHEAGDIPFISALNIQDNSISTEHLLYVDEERYDILRSGKLEKGDLVLCIRGSLGKNGRYPFERGAIASSLVIIRSYLDNDAMYDYISFYLNSLLFQDEMSKYDNGTAQPNLGAGDLSLFAVPLPPLAEQQEIVRLLDRLLGREETVRQSAESVLESVDRMKQSILARAFRGEL